jgi:F0F1-type ATP synthase assembly protein I
MFVTAGRSRSTEMAFNKSDANMLRTAWELSAGMLSFVVALGLGYWFGRTLDRWCGTAPWLTRIFVAFGFVAGVLNVYRTMTRALAPGRPGTPGRP